MKSWQQMLIAIVAAILTVIPATWIIFQWMLSVHGSGVHEKSATQVELDQVERSLRQGIDALRSERDNKAKFLEQSINERFFALRADVRELRSCVPGLGHSEEKH